MATLPPGAASGAAGAGGAGSGLPDAPPPAVGTPPTPGDGPGAAAAATGAPPGAGPQDAVGLLLEMGRQLDALLLQLAESVPMAAAEFGKARELIEFGMAKAISGSGAQEAPSGPVETGNQFPGGLSSPQTGFR